MRVKTRTFTAISFTRISTGTTGLRPAIAQSSTTNGVAANDGVITGIWLGDSTAMENKTYILTPAANASNVLNWTVSGACQATRLC